MQKAAEEGFRQFGYWGSAIVLDPRNGDVLTLVSLPGLRSQRFAAGIDRAAYQALITDKLRPLQNRAIQGAIRRDRRSSSWWPRRRSKRD